MEIEFTVKCNAIVSRKQVNEDDPYNIDEQELIKFVLSNISLDFDDSDYIEYYIEDAYEM